MDANRQSYRAARAEAEKPIILGQPVVPLVPAYSSNAMTKFGWWLGETESRMRSLGLSCHLPLGSLLGRLRTRAARLKDERGRPALAVFAATAFALGVSLRVWRSRA